MINKEALKLSIQKTYRNQWKYAQDALIQWILEKGFHPQDPVFQAHVRSYVELCEKVGEPKMIQIHGQWIDLEFYLSA